MEVTHGLHNIRYFRRLQRLAMVTTYSIINKVLKLSIHYFTIILGLPLIFFIIILTIYFYYPVKDIALFPLNDPKATYTITYRYNQYALEYDGNKSVISHIAYILDSPVDLQSYIGKEVSVTGEFISSDTQCIASHCTLLSTKWSGIRVRTIKLYKPL